MKAYIPMTEGDMSSAWLSGYSAVRSKFLEAQAEIKRLSDDPVRMGNVHATVREAELYAAERHAWCERIEALEKQISELKTKGGGTPDCRRGDRRRKASGRREFDKSLDPLGWGRRAQLDRRKDNEE